MPRRKKNARHDPRRPLPMALFARVVVHGPQRRERDDPRPGRVVAGAEWVEPSR